MYLLDKFSLMILLMASSIAHAYHTIPITPTSSTKPPLLCIQCKHFISQDFFCRSNRAEYGRCRKFYDIHLVTGKKNYEFATIARNSKTMCGTNATYFEERR